jgi:hypothetical protein
MAVPQTNGENHHGHTSGVLAYVHRSVDRVAPPSSRQKAFDDVSAFAKGRPILFVFLASLLAFSVLPLVLFTAFAVSVTATAFTAASLFSLFWVGLAVVVLVPALLISGAGALLFATWVAAGLLTSQWLYQRVPWNVPQTNGPTNGNNETWAEVVAKHEPAPDNAVVPKEEN